MQIKALEEDIGAPLFIRSSRNVQLTKVGEVLRMEAARLIEQAERAETTVWRAAKGLSGSVRIGFVGNAALTGNMASHLAIFRTARPDVEIHVEEIHAARQAEAIARGRIDIGYCPEYGSMQSEDLEAKVLGSWPWMLAASDSLAIIREGVIAGAEMRVLPVILYAADA